MAGIAGIISKKRTNTQYDAALCRMLDKLRFDGNQVSNKFESPTVCFCNVVPIAQTDNINFIHDKEHDVFCVVDGFVFVSEEERELLNKDNSISADLSNHKLIPILYKRYGQDIVNHLTGNYNIFIYDRPQKTLLLFNDRFGYLPLYIYEDDNILVFASKIESILASGLMGNIDFDQTTIAEHLFFNYPISDHTYIKNIYTLPDASIVQINDQVITNRHYWDVSELFGLDSLNKQQSIEAIDSGLKVALDKFFDVSSNPINFSLTGGWDSRVALSYLLPKYTSRFKSYSFGAPTAPDITIPQHIASSEGFSYSPFLLDQQYLDNHFLEDAKNTIMLSSGTRNYKRTHYVHTVKQIGQNSPWLLTGIFGDEILKVGKPQGGAVISKNAVDLIATNFNISNTLHRFVQTDIINLFGDDRSNIINELERRLSAFSKRFSQYTTLGEKYFAFRFSVNLRKYFGNEVNSYNDFVWCYSPFIDFDLLKSFARTKYMVSRFDFVKPKLALQAQSSWLYYELTRRNKVSLTKYQSSRGFSMRDTSSLFGMLKIIYKKRILKKFSQNPDVFSTKTLNDTFNNLIIGEQKNNPFLINENTHISKEDHLSLFYWCNNIKELYS
jgi:asparagine synthetase B (glutamine-hydrolysing)